MPVSVKDSSEHLKYTHTQGIEETQWLLRSRTQWLLQIQRHLEDISEIKYEYIKIL